MERVIDSQHAILARHFAHARLIKAAAAESAAPAGVDGPIVVGLVAQSALGLRRTENGFARLAGERRRRRQEFGRCVRRVLAPILVIAYRGIELPLRAELVGRVAECRVRVVVLTVREECLVRVGRERIRRIDDRRLIDDRYAQSPVRQIARGDEALGVDEVHASDPRKARDRRGCEAQFLAPSLHVDELALTLVEWAAQSGRHTGGQRVIIGSGDRPEIIGIARVDLLGMVVVRDRRERSIPQGVVELECGIHDGTVVRAQIIVLDRRRGVVGIPGGGEIAVRVRLVAAGNDEVVRRGPGKVVGEPQVGAEIVGGLPQQT